ERKAFKKQLKAQAESEEKQEASSEPGRLFFVRFEGSKDADEVENLREEITAILQLAKPQDEVLVSLESPGGTVQGYGLGAAQLLRIRERQIRLSVAVDRVAASGGYLMACVAHQILASPFAILGSIGVVAGLPNFHRLLAKNSIDYKEYTAGEFKRTVSLLGEITEKGEEKFKQQLESIHIQFKDFVSSHRPQLNLAAVATGEHWLASEALGLGLVDRLVTSDDFLLEKFAQGWPIYQVKYTRKQKLVQRLTSQFTQAFTRNMGLWLEKFESRMFS
ncbi:MAG: protease SohB, partial [Bdellovibrio sp.]